MPVDLLLDLVFILLISKDRWKEIVAGVLHTRRARIQRQTK